MTYLTDPQARRERTAELRAPCVPRDRYNFWCVKQELADAYDRIEALEKALAQNRTIVERQPMVIPDDEKP